MIQKSFIFLDKIDRITEKNLWKIGITSWDKFVSTDRIKGLSKARKSYYDRQLRKAQAALYNFDSSYFVNVLPSSETWRLYHFFKEDAVFLDIEVTGVSNADDITVIGLFDGVNTKVMIKGINMDMEYLKNELEKYKLIVSYNGSTFDIPFLIKRYPSLLPNIPHFDLKTACQRLGLKGGLKDIERKLGIRRQNAVVEKLYNGDIIKLYKMYKATGDNHYLNLLIEYNEEDVINLKFIADKIIDLLSKQTFVSFYGMPLFQKAEQF